MQREWCRSAASTTSPAARTTGSKTFSFTGTSWPSSVTASMSASRLARSALLCLLVGEHGGLEVCRRADMQHVGLLLHGGQERLRIRRAQRDEARLEALPPGRWCRPPRRSMPGERRNPLQIGQRRHVHDLKARQLRRRDLDHQHAHRVVGVLRLLHRKANHVVARRVGVRRASPRRACPADRFEDRETVLTSRPAA